MEETTEKQGRWQRFKENSKDEYQLVVRDVKSYREVGSYNLTPLNLYVAISTLIFLVAVVVFLLIAYTPLRTYIPGYGDIVQRQELNEMEDLIDEMGAQMEQQAVTIETMKRNIHGEVVTSADIEERGIKVDTANIEPVPLSEEEVRLRREMALERVGENSRGSSGMAPSPGSTDVPLAQLLLVAPVNGEISAGFKLTGDHLGVDILAPQDTPIKAVRDGIVFISEFTSSNGNVVGIQHDNNLITFYKHNSQLLKKVGDRVRASEAIAIIGNTGELSSGPHLHFELWHEGKAVDPTEFIRF
ncbi:M23 family metallopeptidase [Neolewinella agarilytica]|uniref:Murein DD-endopeptidase MepM and murein hydrolase activator NlpD, contain LysM domain n=1 Tax=Neolewinella agarilytica TaxID=478744 RepID=A0A1H9F7U6_9BACT|nr:M23 family metallopeptidase [Neolewinella agarilytica]SEQ34030.1 Murein DD-endopeptidase MepM and murein hydrolase activator NlpD, contain LysM domain [Neolewinella agarilytica]